MGLGTITALGAMSVGFIACVKEKEVKKIVEEKTKDLSRFKKEELDGDFKTLKDKIAELEKKEVANKTHIDSLLKQLLDLEIQKFETDVASFFGKNLEKTSFKKSTYDAANADNNTGIKLLENVIGATKWSNFNNSFTITNEKELESKITNDKFKLKIVAKGRSETNSPLFVKEIEIRFFDVLVTNDIEKSDTFKEVKGFKNKAALEKKIKEITESDDTKNSNIAKFEVESVSGVDATIKVTMKKNKTIDKDTFVIKGAIARTLNKNHFQGLKVSNKTNENDIIKHLNKHTDFKENNLSLEEDTEVVLSDDKKATKDKNGEIEIKSKTTSKKVQGDLKLTINKIIELKFGTIKSKFTGIKNLDDLKTVNEKLEEIAKTIVGVKKIEAEVQTTKEDIKITITPEDTHIIDTATLDIKGAIKKTINTTDIKSNEEIEKIKDLKDLAEVNIKLSKIKNVSGVTKLEAKLKDGSKTDVVVTITIDETKYKLNGKNTFEIPGAIKAKPETKDKL